MGFFTKHWDEKRASIEQAKAKGEVRIWAVGRRLHVVVPYNEAFPPKARELAGSWRPKTGIWTFNIRTERLVREVCREIYGIS